MLFSGGIKSYNSLEDLKTKYKQEYPTDQLVSIPVAKLQNYKSVPVHLTEEDIRANIKPGEKEILEERAALIRAKKQDVLQVLAHIQSQGDVQRTAKAKELNDLLFDIIFTASVAYHHL